MYIRKQKSSGKIYYQIVEKVNGKLKVIKHLGPIDKILRKFVE